MNWKKLISHFIEERFLQISVYDYLFKVVVGVSTIVVLLESVAGYLYGSIDRQLIIVFLCYGLILINFVSYFYHRNVFHAIYIFVAIFFAGMLYYFSAFAYGQNSHVLYHTAILIFMILLGRKMGTLISTLFIIGQVLIYMVFLGEVEYPLYTFTLSVLNQMGMLVILNAALIVVKHNDEVLKKSTQKLQFDLVKFRHNEATKEKLLSQYQDQKKKEEDVKTALINVLEDLNIEKEKLEKKEKELRNAERIALLGSYVFHIQERKLWWSPEARVIHGYTESEASQWVSFEEYLTLVHPDDVEKITEAMATISSIETVETTYRIQLADSSVRWIRALGAKQQNEKGAEEIAGTFQDITKDIEYQLQIEAEKAKDEAILSSIADGLFMSDQDGKITLFNAAGERMFGWKAEEVVGKNIAEVFPIQTKERTPISYENRPSIVTLTSRHPTSGVYVYTKKDGTEFPANINVAPVIKDDKVYGVIEVFRDVTREQQIDKMKTEFISLASHQLRTPLSGLKWSIEMLITGTVGELNEKQRNLLVNIDNANERMITLVNSLLNVSRIESGRIIIDPKPTNLCALVDTIASDLKVKIQEKDQKIEIECANTDLTCVLDPDLIGQVFQNLITNAHKYSPEHTTITIRLSKDQNTIVCSVSDQGFGIPESEKEKVFTKFYRGTNIISKVTDGNGLGLYLVKSIVDSSGGTITFESSEKSGTTFTFTLPVDGVPPKKGEVKLS